MKKTVLIIYSLFFSLIFFNCKKSSTTVSTSGQTPVKVQLTDAVSTSYGEVNIEVTGIEFKMESGSAVNLNVRPKILNLLNFVNGKDTLLAYDTIPSGKLSQIRLILGTANSVKLNGSTYPLNTPSAQQSGLKLNVDKVLVPGVVYELLLDFDAGRSIVATGNGTLQLKPVIRVIDNAISGSIAGSISNTAALPALIMAANATDTLSTIANNQGAFLIRGVPAGKYTVTVTPQSSFQPKTIADVNVTIGNQTNLGAISF